MLKPSYLLATALLLFTTTAHAKRLNHEAVYQEQWCADIGEIEYVLPDKSRVDCLTKQYAIEFDFADKWAEAIGQSLLYANATGREPGIVLIMEDAEKDFKYLVRLLRAIEGDPKRWNVWIVEPDSVVITPAHITYPYPSTSVSESSGSSSQPYQWKADGR